jgi:F-type H+-transporting ATPase subunit gamma
MPNLQDMRRRVRAVKNMRQITKAMKMVSAAKLRRAQERVTAARPYTVKMMQVLGDIARRTPDFRHPLLASSRESSGAEGEGRAARTLLVLVTADKGLCGGFNTNLNKAAQNFVRERAGEQVELVIIGRKGFEYFQRRPVTIRREYIGVTGTGRVDFLEAQRIAREVVADFTSEESPVDGVYLLYNEFKSALQQRPVVEPMLPIGRIETAESEQMTDYLYEQAPDEILGELLPKLVETQLYRALLESVASEHGARMTAMDSASKNAGEMIDQLTLTMNRARQAAITREIIEVVSGAEAL